MKLLPVVLGLAAGVFAGAAEPYYLNAAEITALAAKSPAALKAPITTVMDKTQFAASGDPHDYVSYARYYWPDPTKPDGLPFVSHDGKHNHEQVARGDRHRIGNFCETVEKLAAAWHVQRDEAAARRAGEWLRAWFITPATRMNPHLEYAQVRLGRNNNRGNAAGMLDSRGFANVIDALRLLDDSPALTAAEQAAVREWFTTFLQWFTTAKIALEERAAKNNHGSWYFAQAIPIARYAGRDDLARTLVAESKVLLSHQIQPDGSQPEEIRRVDGLGYSRFNLEALALVARHAAGLGIDLWNYTAPNGASLRKALDFLRPYNQAPEKWPHTQNEKLPPGFLDELIAEAARAQPAAS
ncbi:MAG TPA: alginate lyase family protein [Lacunisphaera sp.]